MFELPAVIGIAVVTGLVTNQVTKYGWKKFLDSMIDHDETKPKPAPKHYRCDNGIDQVMSSKFPETLKGSDEDGRTNRTVHNA